MKIPLWKAVLLGIIPKELGSLKRTGPFYEAVHDELCLSEECIQDIVYYNRQLNSDRTGPLTEEEIKGWQEMEKYLDNLDMEKAKKRVVVLDGNRCLP